MSGRREESPNNKVEALSTRIRQREERIQHVLECLSEESAKGTPIIVEGKNDTESLRLLGVGGRILTAKTGGKSRLDAISEVEKTRAREVILLLDFDRRGKELTEILREHLEKAKIKPNITFWRDIMALAGKEVKDIEGLAAYMETLKKKICEM